MNTEDRIFYTLMFLFGCSAIWALISVIILAAASADCLERGHPEATITYDLKTYCISYEGAVRPVVEQSQP